MFWCVKKQDFTAIPKLCVIDINTTHMGFGELKHYSEKKVHIGFSAQYVEGSVAKQKEVSQIITK